MKTDYSHFSADKQYDIFRKSEFSAVIEDRLSGLVIKGRKCAIVFRPVPDNPDVVSFSCFDLDAKATCKGTPEAGKFLLTRRAYEDFRGGHSNSDNVKKDLKRIEEFLFEVKKGTK